MSPTAVRFALLTFVLLSGAMATNIFVLQPPSRQLAAVAPARDSASDAMAGWNGPTAPAETSAKKDAVIPRLETGAVHPLANTADRSDLVRAIQRELKAKGYETGAVDGVPGLVTRGAIMAYESDAGLPLTGEPQQSLLQHIVLGSADGRQASAQDTPGPEAEAVIRAVQRAFRQLGYITTLPDGRLNDSTRRAIRKFELDRKLKETGRISGELLAKLASLAGDALQTATQ